MYTLECYYVEVLAIRYSSIEIKTKEKLLLPRAGLGDGDVVKLLRTWNETDASCILESAHSRRDDLSLFSGCYKFQRNI